MADVNLRNIDYPAMTAIKQAAAITNNTTTGFFRYSAVKYAVALLEAHGSPLPAGLDTMLRRGPLTELEALVGCAAPTPQPATVGNELEQANDMLLGSIARMRAAMVAHGIDDEDISAAVNGESY